MSVEGPPRQDLQEQVGPLDRPSQNPPGDELQPGDAYMEGPYLVFTEQYHLRRGYCCNSGCRHCPYR